jgi:hypothetical protein
MLALTRHDCVDPRLTPAARVALDAWRADLLDRPWPRGYNDLPALAKNRLHLRRAGVWAARAHQLSRLNRPPQAAAERALAELAAVDKSEFSDDDQVEYADAAIRVGAARWAAVPLPAAGSPATAAGLRLVTRAGAEPGQTCVQLLAAEGTRAQLVMPGRSNAGAAGAAQAARAGHPGHTGQTVHAGQAAHAGHAASVADGPALLAERCTFGTVWTGSVSVRPGGGALALAVQPLEGWTELWLFRAPSRTEGTEGTEGAEGVDRARGPDRRTAWRIDVLPPAVAAPGLGYVEFAGWVPGAQPRLLIARESRIEGRLQRRFEVLALDSLQAVKQASTPQLLVAFGQFSDAQWRRRSVALR